MKTTSFTAEAFAYGIMVTSISDTLRMVSGALAATSGYAVMVTSKWGRDTLKMEIEGEDAHGMRLMELKGNLVID